MILNKDQFKKITFLALRAKKASIKVVCRSKKCLLKDNGALQWRTINNFHGVSGKYI